MWVFCWIFHIGFLLDSIFIDFGMGFPKGLGWLWVRFSSGFGLILSWVFWWFGLIFCWFWVNFVVDYQLLKWVAVVMVGWYWVGGWVFLLLFFSYSFNGLLCPLGKRGNLNGEREKKKKKYIYIYILLYTTTIAMYIYTVTVASV